MTYKNFNFNVLQLNDSESNTLLRALRDSGMLMIGMISKGMVGIFLKTPCISLMYSNSCKIIFKTSVDPFSASTLNHELETLTPSINRSNGLDRLVSVFQVQRELRHDGFAAWTVGCRRLGRERNKREREEERGRERKKKKNEYVTENEQTE